jgi:hypothetical protein
MVIEDAALLNRRVTHMTPAALFSRRLLMFLLPLAAAFVFGLVLHRVPHCERPFIQQQ